MERELTSLRLQLLAENQRKLQAFQDRRQRVAVQVPTFDTPHTISFPDAVSVLNPRFKRIGFSYLPLRGYFRIKENYGKFTELDAGSSNISLLLTDNPVAEAEFVHRLSDPSFTLEEAVQFWRQVGTNPLLTSFYTCDAEDRLERAVIAKMRDVLIFLKGVTFTILSIKSDEKMTMGNALSNFAQCYCRICHKYICSVHDLNPDYLVSQQENRSQEPHFQKCNETRCRELLLRFEPLLRQMESGEVRTFRNLYGTGSIEEAHELLIRFKLFDVFGYQICKLGNYLAGCCQERIMHLTPLKLKHIRRDSEAQLRKVRKRQAKVNDISVSQCSHEGPCIGPDCPCAAKEACQKQCGCDWNCPLRFPGCACMSSCKPGAESNTCPCVATGRECDPDVCECNNSKDCSNLLVRNYFMGEKVPRTSIAVSTIEGAGLGLFAREAIRADHCIGVYAGELSRVEDNDLLSDRPNYKWAFDEQHVINAKCKGNKTRFMNHKDQGLNNIAVKCVEALGNCFVVFTAARKIQPGEELTINYGKDFDRII